MFVKKFLMIYICYIWFSPNCESAKILAVLPVPSISHHVVFRPLIHELAKRGHNVIVVTPDPAFQKRKTPANLTEIDVHDISYEIWRNKILQMPTGKQTDLTTQVSTVLDVILEIFIKQIQAKEVNNIIFQRQHFDLVIIEACVRPALALSHLIKAPFIQISSFGSPYGLYENMRAPSHQLLYPSVSRQKLNNLSLWVKVRELYNNYSFQSIFKEKEPNENNMLRKYFGVDMPDLKKLVKNVDMLFLNSNPIFENNRPVPPNIVYIQGIQKNVLKTLPKELLTLLDRAQHGVIYMSFGTNIDPTMLPKEKFNGMMKVLSKLPYQILLKWNNDELPLKSDNIYVSKWYPQSDLLKHPNVKLFITQGGLQSTQEAIDAGVPLIGVPIFSDQWYNVEKCVYHHIGIRLDMEDFTEEIFLTSIETIFKDDRYKTNINKLKALIEDQPQASLDRAVWWTEYVIRHRGAKHLKPKVADISWAEYLELNLVLLLVTMFTLTISLLYLIIKKIKHLIIIINNKIHVGKLKKKVK